MKQPSVKWGVIGALVSFLYGVVILFTVGIGKGGSAFQWIGFIIPVVVIAMAIREDKASATSSFSFSAAFMTGAQTVLIMVLLGIVLTYVQFAFIAPTDYQDTIISQAMPEWEKAGLTEAQIEQSESITRSMSSPLAMGIFGAVVGGIFGLIVSAICGAAFSTKEK
jgi:hypothetical protein